MLGVPRRDAGHHASPRALLHQVRTSDYRAIGGGTGTVAMPTLDGVGTTRTSRCTACGTERPRGARFCPRCGDPQPVGGDPARGRRPVRAALAVPAALVVVLAASLALATTLGDGLPERDAEATGGSLEDASIDLDPDTAVRERSPAREAAAAEQAPAATCRRSDRARSPCGPELPVGVGDPEALLLLREDLAVVRVDHDLVGIDLLEGAERWRTRVFVTARSVRTASDDELLIVAVTSGLAAVEHATGAIRWTASFAAAPSELPTRQLTTSITSVPVWVGDRGVLAVEPTGRLHAFDRDDGADRWVASMDAPSVVATSRGLLSVGREGLRLWHPDDPDPRWQRSGTDLRLHPTSGAPARRRPPEPVAAPLPLTTGRWLVDLDGGMVPLPSPGPVEVALVGDVTVAVTWPEGVPDGDAGTSDEDRGGDGNGARAAGALPTVTAFDADGEQRWQRADVPLGCCEVETVPSPDGELVLTTPGDPRGSPTRIVVMDTADGTIGDLPGRDGATLEALTPTTVVWREDGRLIGLDRGTGREAFRATGSLAAVDPLVIQGRERSIVVTEGGRTAPSAVTHPGPRWGPYPAVIQGRGTAS